MKLTYRPEIDGLRTIAVVAVILYHARIAILGYQPFEGGFIGVDIFFVISGYLITSFILKELITTGSFSFKQFYERRVRRLIPALLFVMLASLPFAWMYLLPSSFVDFSKSILYSLSFISNFYFHYSGQQYGAESGLFKPFLHTWSLSVEEQFYILFPVFLFITFKYFRKYLIHILIIGFVISLGLADWSSKNHPYFSFYLLPTRMWELLAGSILAYFEITKGHRSKHNTLNLILPTIGLFLIVHSILFFNHDMFHPSLYTLSPVIGVCLIIWFSNEDELITKILSTKLFVGIGLISYSLYLWHYPIFAFARMRDGTSIENGKFEWIILTIIFSLISYFFIERPARNKKKKISKILLLISISISILLLVLNYQNKRLSEFKIRSGMDGMRFDQNQLIGKSKNKFILFGDSHATHVMSYLKDISILKDISFYNVTESACISLPTITNYYNTTKIKKFFKSRESCAYLYKNIIKILNENKDEPIVVLYNVWFHHIIKNNSTKYNEDLKFNDDQENNERIIRIILEDVINLKKIANVKKKWIIVGKNPGSYNYNFGSFLNCYNAKKSNIQQPYHEVSGCEKKGLIKNGSNYLNHKLFKKIISSNYADDLIYIDVYKLYCDETFCYNFTDQNELIYKDHHHFTYEGSKKIVNKIVRTYNELKSN
ncbi:acyltransferase [Candidatus Pelagibacter ubique]|nr:acyltransferase [Candidatus Pelagibacter ubique]